MGANHQELEVKFLVPDLASTSARLQSLGAKQVQPRVHEVNLRYDNPQGDLLQNRQVLRLRHDTASRLTYKGPGRVLDGINQRQELEFEVSDFETAQAFLEALGFQVVWMYEKFRQVFALNPVLVTLDEMPFGTFMEIEGPDAASIQAAARQLGLDWEKRILDSYAGLFGHLKAALGLDFRDLSFANFTGIQVAQEVFESR